MSHYTKVDPWKIIEEGFDPSKMRSSESLFSLGNGIMGSRANFEEHYSGHSLQGSYIGGIYYPDKTRVGWWKNGYPEYFAKVLNSAFWVGIDVEIDGTRLDLNKVQVRDFRRELDMRHGVLCRELTVLMPSGAEVRIEATRFISLTKVEVGAIRYKVTPLNQSIGLRFSPYIDGDVRNEDANYSETFWEKVALTADSVTMRTKKTDFTVTWAMENRLAGAEWCKAADGEATVRHITKIMDIKAGQSVTLDKLVGVSSSLNHAAAETELAARREASSAAAIGFDKLLADHSAAWEHKWQGCDIEITGDDAAQQGIRFCIFQLLQTYTGRDSRLNVGPKGFTGEKYGGSTYWDTEAYCLPFYMATAGEKVARELLVYRYNQLDKAIENASKLGFRDGAALYPMVTMNGEECHNEWEITFEEIHRNGAIAYAIYNYVRYTGDRDYLTSHGLEVLIGIARFWSQRITFSEERGKYVMLGVTGPNEYENNVNNNWYTNYIALWCMRYAFQSASWVMVHHNADYTRIADKCGFDYDRETSHWRTIWENIHIPYNEKLGVFMQQDGYMDKEQLLAADLDPAERPINQHWSWDRILRSCFIKQADVLQGMYFFGDDFDADTLRRNFDFYEPRTVHESSLSPCVHSILATRIGDMERAYNLYLRTSRLDLDDYNNEIAEGLHITSMAGSWLSVVEGFGGMSVRDDMLCFDPALPREWEKLSFKVLFRNRVIKICIDRKDTKAYREEGEKITIKLNGSIIEL